MTVKDIIEQTVQNLSTKFSFIFGDKGYQNIEADYRLSPFFFLEDDFSISSSIKKSETQVDTYSISAGIYFESSGLDASPEEKWKLKTQALATKNEFLFRLQTRTEVQEISNVVATLIGLPESKDNFVTGIDLAFDMVVIDSFEYCF